MTLRCFVAIDLPPPVQDALARVQQAIGFGRAVEAEQMHLTLAFLGEQPDDLVEAAHHALEAVRFPAFQMQLAGLSSFGGDVLWAGVREPAQVQELQARIGPALHGAGLVLERRRFRPHVTLARFPRPDPERLARMLTLHAAFPCPPFQVTDFALWQSTLTRHGAVHEELARYPLRG